MKPSGEIPARIEEIVAGHRRLERARAGHDAASFDPLILTDPERALRALLELPRGGAFLEWGSGLGTVTLLAAALGFDACGIEIRRDLVDISRERVRALSLPARFACGNFIPLEYRENPEVLDEDLRHEGGGADGYRALGMDLREFDVVFGFPWPDEVGFFCDIFDQCASSGARLLLNLGRDGIQQVRGPGAQRS